MAIRAYYITLINFGFNLSPRTAPVSKHCPYVPDLLSANMVKLQDNWIRFRAVSTMMILKVCQQIIALLVPQRPIAYCGSFLVPLLII